MTVSVAGKLMCRGGPRADQTAAAMEVDSAKPVKVGSKKIEKKRRVKKSKIVFPKYGEKFSKKRK